jgi:hypothetical protein
MGCGDTDSMIRASVTCGSPIPCFTRLHGVEVCSAVADRGDYIESRVQHDEKMQWLVDAGLLLKRPAEVGSVEELGDFIACTYWQLQQPRSGGGGGKLPLAVAEPDALVERAIELAGESGMGETRLREALKPLAQKRLEIALQRLEAANVIRCQVEHRETEDRTLTSQRVWFLAS